MNVSKSLIAVGVGLAMAAGPVLAKTNNNNNQDNDSVYSWGRWAVLAPAAGNPGVGLQVIGGGLATRDTTPPPGVVPPSEQPPGIQGPCAAGAACGFATYASYTSNNNSESYNQYAPVAANLGPTDGSSVGSGVQGTGDQLYYTVDPANPSDAANYPHIDSGTLTVSSLSSSSFYASGSNTVFDNTSFPITGGYLYGSIGGNFTPVGGTVPVIAGYWYASAEHYVAYDPDTNTFKKLTNGSDFYTGSDGGEGNFVFGVTPTADQLAVLQAAANPVANYSGTMLQNGTSFTMQVNFADATWSGSWNGGADGNYVNATTDPAGRKYLTGPVGFNASGVVSGPNIVATSITATDGTINAGSSVNGAVFGPTAGAVGGIADINKTTSSYTNANQTDVFMGTKQ